MNMPTCKEAGNRPLYTSTQLTVSNEGKKAFRDLQNLSLKWSSAHGLYDDTNPLQDSITCEVKDLTLPGVM